MRWKVISITSVLPVLCWIGAAFGGGVGGEEAQKELQKLQGTWIMVSGERDGKKVADEHIKQSRITYDGTKMEIITPHQSSETIAADIVKIDPSKTPKELHFIRRNGPNAGKTMVGIYEFEGDEKYRFAFDPSGASVLKEFTTKAGTGYILHTWKRAKQ
jgi:uncharacterized protein (TIGR03067 family)